MAGGSAAAAANTSGGVVRSRAAAITASRLGRSKPTVIGRRPTQRSVNLCVSALARFQRQLVVQLSKCCEQRGVVRAAALRFIP